MRRRYFHANHILYQHGKSAEKFVLMTNALRAATTEFSSKAAAIQEAMLDLWVQSQCTLTIRAQKKEKAYNSFAEYCRDMDEQLHQHRFSAGISLTTDLMLP